VSDVPPRTRYRLISSSGHRQNEQRSCACSRDHNAESSSVHLFPFASCRFSVTGRPHWPTQSVTPAAPAPPTRGRAGCMSRTRPGCAVSPGRVLSDSGLRPFAMAISGPGTAATPCLSGHASGTRVLFTCRARIADAITVAILEVGASRASLPAAGTRRLIVVTCLRQIADSIAVFVHRRTFRSNRRTARGSLSIPLGSLFLGIRSDCEDGDDRRHCHCTHRDCLLHLVAPCCWIRFRQFRGLNSGYRPPFTRSPPFSRVSPVRDCGTMGCHASVRRWGRGLHIPRVAAACRTVPAVDPASEPSSDSGDGQ
jgi:hypothetical protein